MGLTYKAIITRKKGGVTRMFNWNLKDMLIEFQAYQTFEGDEVVKIVIEIDDGEEVAEIG